MKPFAIYHEHPDWFKPLFAELEKRGIALRTHRSRSSIDFDITDTANRYSLFFNRMSPSAYLRDGGQGIFFTLSYLQHLELFWY